MSFESENFEKMAQEAEKLRITNIAALELFSSPRMVKFDLDMTLTVGLIGQLQLAFRHPGNTGPTRVQLEKFVRDLIEQIDPTRGEVYQFLMMGFNPECDE